MLSILFWKTLQWFLKLQHFSHQLSSKCQLFPLKPSSQRGLMCRDGGEAKSDALPGSTPSERWWGTWKPACCSPQRLKESSSDWTIRMLCGTHGDLVRAQNLTEWQFRVPKVTDSHCDDVAESHFREVLREWNHGCIFWWKPEGESHAVAEGEHCFLGTPETQRSLGIQRKVAKVK